MRWLALVINVFMILGIMSLGGFTLTLPGIAGLVLTIGAAVDANVLINERIREEQRKGRGVIQSVEVGYRDAHADDLGRQHASTSSSPIDHVLLRLRARSRASRWC